MNVRTKLAVAVLAAVFAVVLAAPAQADPPGDTLQSGYQFEYLGPGTGTADDPVRPDDRAERTGAPSAETRAVRPDDRGGARGPGAVDAPEFLIVDHPDNRAGVRGPGGVTAVVAYRGMLPSDYGQPNVVVADVGRFEGFDWGDALIGGLSGAGMALLLTGSAFLLLSLRNRARTA